MPLTKEEVWRKVLHIFSGSLIPAAIFYLPDFAEKNALVIPGVPAVFLPSIILIVALVLFLGVEQIRFRFPAMQKIFGSLFGYMLRPEESKTTTGATYLAASSLICALLFFNNLHIAAMVICLFIWGDAIAAIVGISMGRIKIGKKSLEGSLACFVLCLAVEIFLFPIVPGLLDSWNGNFPIVLAIVTALTITLLELFPIRIGKTSINDNLYVPVAAGVVMLFGFPLLG